MILSSNNLLPFFFNSQVFDAFGTYPDTKYPIGIELHCFGLDDS